MQRGIVASDLAIELTVAPGVGNNRTFALVDDGISTGVFCQVIHPATTCNSGGATRAINPGSDIAIRGLTFNTPAAADALIGWRATTP